MKVMDNLMKSEVVLWRNVFELLYLTKVKILNMESPSCSTLLELETFQHGLMEKCPINFELMGENDTVDIQDIISQGIQGLKTLSVNLASVQKSSDFTLMLADQCLDIVELLKDEWQTENKTA